MTLGNCAAPPRFYETFDIVWSLKQDISILCNLVMEMVLRKESSLQHHYFLCGPYTYGCLLNNLIKLYNQL